MGGMADPVKRRIARMADGWLPQFQPGDEADEHLADLYAHAEEVDRDPDDIGIHGRVYAEPGEEDEWVERLQGWQDLGADHVSVNTMYQGLEADEHTDHIEEVADVLSETGLL